ncbi:MAG: heme-binding domain-containing protein [Bacteroidota bacterium]
MTKKIIYLLLALLVFIQFFRPTKNISNAEQPQAINKVYTVPTEVEGILKNACFDCHSNTTNYPWYINIQPVAWWMNDHIEEGKRKLNFSEFGSYTLKKQDHKLDELTDEIKENMPLKSYTFVHKEAKLSTLQRKQLADWANGLRKEIQSKLISLPK